eukprot:gene22821-29992_t
MSSQVSIPKRRYLNIHSGYKAFAVVHLGFLERVYLEFLTGPSKCRCQLEALELQFNKYCRLAKGFEDPLSSLKTSSTGVAMIVSELQRIPVPRATLVAVMPDASIFARGPLKVPRTKNIQRTPEIRSSDLCASLTQSNAFRHAFSSTDLPAAQALRSFSNALVRSGIVASYSRVAFLEMKGVGLQLGRQNTLHKYLGERASSVISLRLIALWQRHGNTMMFLAGAVAVYFIWKGTSGLASMFVDINESKADLACMKHYTADPNRVYRLAMRELKISPAVLEVLGAPVVGSDLRAIVQSGGNIRLKDMSLKRRSSRVQMIFPLSGSKQKGLVSVEAKKKQVSGREGSGEEGSDLRAIVQSGGNIRLKDMSLKRRSSWVQMIFPLSGSKQKGLVSVEAKKKQGSYQFKLLAVDVRPDASITANFSKQPQPAEERIYLEGGESIYNREGILGGLREPFLRVASLEATYDIEDDVDDDNAKLNPKPSALSQLSARLSQLSARLAPQWKASTSAIATLKGAAADAVAGVSKPDAPAPKGATTPSATPSATPPATPSVGTEKDVGKEGEKGEVPAASKSWFTWKK